MICFVVKVPELIAKAEEALELVQKEKDILHRLQTGQEKGGWFTQGDQISWYFTYIKHNTTRLNTLCVSNTTLSNHTASNIWKYMIHDITPSRAHLEEVLEASTKFGIETKKGLFLERLNMKLVRTHIIPHT